MDQNEWVALNGYLDEWSFKKELDGTIALKNPWDDGIFTIHPVAEVREDGCVQAIHELDSDTWLVGLDAAIVRECLILKSEDGYYFGYNYFSWKDSSRVEKYLEEISCFLQNNKLKVTGAFFWVSGNDYVLEDIYGWVYDLQNICDLDAIWFLNMYDPDDPDKASVYHVILACQPTNTH